MRKLALLTFVTLDGVMQAPGSPDEDRSGGFDGGGWAAPYWEGTMEQVQREAMAAPYDILFGRKTYELFAGYWPKAESGPVTNMMNAARKHVVTSSQAGLKWNNSSAVTGNTKNEIARLKAQEGPLLQIHGSWQLIQSLLKYKLIDEFRIWTFPVTAGAGKRLFEPGGQAETLRMEKSQACDNGVLMSFYTLA